MKIDKNHRELVLFLRFFILSLVMCVCADLLGHNSMGAYVSPISFNEIDWVENVTCSMVSGIFLTLLTHKSKKK